MKKVIPWNLIKSYLKGEIAEEDEILFREWLSVPQNKLLFQHIEKLWIAVIASSSSYTPDTSYYWAKMKERIDAKKTVPFLSRYKQIIIYAASFVGIVWGTLYSWNILSVHPESVSFIETVQRPDNVTNSIQLILSEQESVSVLGEDASVVYDKGGSIKVNSENLAVDKPQKQTQSNKRNVKEQSVFNQLVVPTGKRSSLVLADGTKVWVNSGSRVVYPVTFEKEKREIYVDGEVFLDVMPDKTCPFIVKTNKMNIRVLGTAFNVNAYENDKEQSVVLVSGKVNVQEKTKQLERNLAPNEMFITPEEGSTSVRTVDVTNYVSWKDGLYRFNSEDLSVILNRLSRYYGVEIILKNSSLNVKCSGKLYLKDDFKTIMNNLSEMFSIKYEWIDNKCYILK